MIHIISGSFIKMTEDIDWDDTPAGSPSFAHMKFGKLRDASTEGTDLPRDMISITCTECLTT